MKRLFPALLTILVLGFSAGAFAGDRWEGHRGWQGGYSGHGHGYGHYRHNRGHHSSFSFVLGAPLYWPSYYRPYAYRPYGWYAQPPVIVQQAPVTYVQRETPPATVATEEYWYFCPDTRSYYPYTQTCPSEWLQVVPQTAPQ
jgi:hypothetical protein